MSITSVPEDFDQNKILNSQINKEVFNIIHHIQVFDYRNDDICIINKSVLNRINNEFEKIHHTHFTTYLELIKKLEKRLPNHTICYDISLGKDELMKLKYLALYLKKEREL